MTAPAASPRPPRHPFAKLVGLHLAPPAAGACAGWLDAGPHLHNPVGIVHGGALFSLADTCMGAALFSQLPPGQNCTTVEIKINYLKSVVEGRVDCLAHVLSQGEAVAVVEASLSQNGTPVALCLGTFAVLRRE